MSMKAKILEVLRERETYISGQELCEQFGVSRTAVWKAIGQLKKEGYVIEAVQNKGYHLVEQAQEVYNQADIQSRLKTKWVGHPLLFFDSIDSTNIRSKAGSGTGRGERTVSRSGSADRRTWQKRSRLGEPCGDEYLLHINVKAGFQCGLRTHVNVSHGTGGGKGHPADTWP